ncbi:tumor necrosis factor receptor superfamily member 13B [Callorhinchus milii]|uniref:tumor necrosis factor receptor superfamily member 13B n=1 Tax=Callorhinchus milii TaxID=7868 RepID=UPI0004573E02|nr:tumor necrosis factor receptor superfamily member 13B [Callorhinchus milii]XP_007891733.1 tumor necrosis factor receptor superfamily member 13B [Callorhinchus milii]XP_007891734.1 tumor necrosis factor receptor superfamily member 13B [Callorhinchus milii]|eukprot:gi/632952219/ref/XP_007891732.1/ PREDICTED: tumor necrosis factor receptor superfamily member 13B [Callorhinchus milii]
MKDCSDDEFWDQLLRKCSQCTNHCGEHVKVMCRAYCEVQRCKDASQSYWDKLLRKCVKCSDVCGQHPQQCSNICQENTVFNSDTVSTFRHCLPTEEHFNILIYTVLAVSLCVVTCVFLMLLVYSFRRKVSSTRDAAVTGHKRDVSSKDRLVQVGVDGDEQNRSLSSEPSETCSYCCCERKLTEREKKEFANTPAGHQCLPIPPIARTQSLAPVPAHKDKTFQIICSPSQAST